VPKRKRKEQHHLRQESSRKRSFTVGGTAPQDIYKPGFPMNLFGNLKLFSVIGVVIVIFMVFAAVLTRDQGTNTVKDDFPTPTATATTDPNATPSATVSPTPNPKSFQKADQVIDATKNSYKATIKTSKGDIVLDLKADVAPNTVNSFVFLAQKGFFDGITFHRVVKSFVIQSGDPTGTGSGGPGYKTKDEPNQVPNKRGTVAMAKSAGAGDFGSQFFISVGNNSSLDFNNTQGDKFYPFAEVSAGMDIVDAISNVATDARQKPTEPITIQSVTVQATPKQ
jgi:cyclophilin family peptidyl-prolyl cis-trans isomerase